MHRKSWEDLKRESLGALSARWRECVLGCCSCAGLHQQGGVVAKEAAAGRWSTFVP